MQKLFSLAWPLSLLDEFLKIHKLEWRKTYPETEAVSSGAKRRPSAIHSQTLHPLRRPNDIYFQPCRQGLLTRRSGSYTLKAKELHDAGRGRHTFQPSARGSAARIANHAKSICRVARQSNRVSHPCQGADRSRTRVAHRSHGNLVSRLYFSRAILRGGQQ